MYDQSLSVAAQGGDAGGINLSFEQMIFLGHVTLLFKKMAKALIDLKKSQMHPNQHKKAVAMVYKRERDIQRFVADNQTDGGTDEKMTALSAGVDKAVDSILSDLKQSKEPQIKVYKWLGIMAECIPDSALPEKALMVKRVAKMINDMDDDDELSDDEMRELLLSKGAA